MNATQLMLERGVILTVRLGWIFLQCLLASLGQQEASLTLHCGKNPAPNFRLLADYNKSKMYRIQGILKHSDQLVYCLLKRQLLRSNSQYRKPIVNYDKA
jgi:hypothetical protein